MADRIYPIEHNGKEIYFTDWSNLRAEAEAVAAIELTTSFVEQLKKYNLLGIIDVTNSISTPNIIGNLISAAKMVKQFSRKKTIVGLVGTKFLFLKTVNKFVNTNIVGFATLEEAKDWIVVD